MQFTVIIPARDEERNIGRCLDSIARVEWDASEFEIIVADNGSQDRTAEIAAQMGATVYKLPGLTISALRNYAASRARGAILAFMDADCTVEPSWLREASKYLDREEIACFGAPPQVPAQSTWVQRAWFEVRRKKVSLGETSWLESMNMFVRREAFSGCGGFDEKLVTCEDYDLSVRLRELGGLFTDSSIAATHYGEAATLAHFFRKELWRGIGNLKGVSSHGIRLSELPSLCLPLWHCLVLLILAGGICAGGVFGVGVALYAASLFLLWQSLLLSLCLFKYYRGSLCLVAQIFVLLNVYYVARGVASLRQA
ncbi:glycosyltransferase [Citrifermentans bremense]|uniref:glycosyltransferase n=1 Tax=Citrifermentans bremense TaxID=60035 RepID=UPI0004272919|nr:glycosyltransferase [Citrifermentans bremense]